MSKAKLTPSFADKVRRGDLLLGTVISIPSPELTEILAHCGFDWLFIDAEHGGFNPQETVPLLQAAGSCPCIIRVPAHDEVWLKKALDVGPAGVIVPQVNTAEAASRIISMCKYPPLGTRGVGLSRASNYGLNLAQYLGQANDTTAIVLQAEHKDAAANIDSILELDGIDAILVGPFDMSASLGKPGQTSDAEVVALIEQITQSCEAKGVTLGTAVASSLDARSYIEKGYRLVAAGIDALHVADSAKRLLSDIKTQ